MARVLVGDRRSMKRVLWFAHAKKRKEKEQIFIDNIFESIYLVTVLARVISFLCVCKANDVQ